ncbi:tyrosine-protein kinase YwqD [Paenibacillus glycanilyticus]|uniref:non-specific protein-tyrosine kinase n=1 Tax=Paenibacillus glycanilyticus TaxID=126569 RepID=A0ABQ6NNK1_9BACL|nr:CpsD/CapB family tyrosine-protein kinase [Paenibacillus glycanilyticus]GMK46686.1 tyrosine-protein kinase YwqD [Paenibacillus glycanilyticus]
MYRNVHESKLVAHVNSSSSLSEAYRTLRTNIMFSGIDDPVRTIMLTSASPGEGKTTTVANLAVTFAHEGKKTLLVDADLRKPSVHIMFKKSNRSGLTDALFKENPWQEIVHETEIEHLHLLTAGIIPPNPSEILSSRRMSELVEEWRVHYDVILFDTPPLLAVADGMILSALCDGVILVIKSGKTKFTSARKVLSQLEFAKARVLGTVLNNKKRSKDSGYHYGYGQ